MPEFIKKYNFDSLYICLLLIIYNIWNSNYYYINIILAKLYLLNYTSLIIIINIIGIYLFLKNISFEINIKMVYK
jgi:hypothetical protein